MSGTLFDSSYKRLHTEYIKAHSVPSDINEHVQLFSQYAAFPTVNSILELGVNEGFSTVGWMWGLVNKQQQMIGIKTELHICGPIITDKIRILKSICEECGSACSLYEGNDVDPNIQNLPKEVDLTFIDSMHNFPHMVAELKRFAPLTRHYIVLHDTTIDAYSSEQVRTGADLEAVSHDTGYTVEEIKIGIWPAVVNFLQSVDGQWIIEKHLSNNNGLTVLKRTTTQ